MKTFVCSAGLRVAGDRLALRIGRQPDAGRERGEVEEVAVVLRQVLDLLRGDVGRRPPVVRVSTACLPTTVIDSLSTAVGVEHEVDVAASGRRGRSSFSAVRLEAGRGHDDVVRARREAGQRVRAVRRRL